MIGVSFTQLHPKTGLLRNYSTVAETRNLTLAQDYELNLIWIFPMFICTPFFFFLLVNSSMKFYLMYRSAPNLLNLYLLGMFIRKTYFFSVQFISVAGASF